VGGDLNVTGIPEAIAVHEDGNIYVSDYSLGRVQIFDADGNFLESISSESVINSLFKRPTGIAFDNNGKMFVANQSGNSVSIVQLP
jgi:DNA-binding beta-propeller fold protein YncE